MRRESNGTNDVAAELSGSKRTKFVSLAESRTVNAIKAIRVIGKLGNRAAYEYDETDINKITRVLAREVESLRARMLTKGSRETVDFTL